MRAEGFSCSLDVLYGGLEIRKLQLQSQKLLVIKTLDPDALEMLDPNSYQDPDSMNEFSESVFITLTSDPLFHYAD